MGEVVDDDADATATAVPRLVREVEVATSAGADADRFPREMGACPAFVWQDKTGAAVPRDLRS
jgi:hypothetical protein